MWTEYFVPVISAGIASLAFAIIFNTRGKNLLISALCGAFGWGVYLLCDAWGDSTILPYFISGTSIALFSEIAAIIFRSPATVFLMAGFIPSVPGGAVYRAMEACLFGDIAGFAEGLINTLKIGGALTLGIIFMSSVTRLVRGVFRSRAQK